MVLQRWRDGGRNPTSDVRFVESVDVTFSPSPNGVFTTTMFPFMSWLLLQLRVRYLCVIHQLALVSKAVDVSHGTTLVSRTASAIRAKGLQQRLYKAPLEEGDAVHSHLLRHAEVTQTSCSLLLTRCLRSPQLWSHVEGGHHEEPSHDLGLLADLTD